VENDALGLAVGSEATMMEKTAWNLILSEFSDIADQSFLM
jgi:hypothetical protein